MEVIRLVQLCLKTFTVSDLTTNANGVKTVTVTASEKTSASDTSFDDMSADNEFILDG